MNAKTILLVDDDIDVLEPIQYLLIEEGHKVITASNGSEAITEYKENKPAITFMDIKMPVLDGYEAFNKIKSIDKDAKIVFTSGYAIDNERFQNAKKLGLCDILIKPFNIDAMIKMIKKHTNQIKH